MLTLLHRLKGCFHDAKGRALYLLQHLNSLQLRDMTMSDFGTSNSVQDPSRHSKLRRRTFCCHNHRAGERLMGLPTKWRAVSMPTRREQSGGW